MIKYQRKHTDSKGFRGRREAGGWRSPLGWTWRTQDGSKGGKGRLPPPLLPSVTFPPERKNNTRLPRTEQRTLEGTESKPPLKAEIVLKTSPSLRSFKYKPFSKYPSTLVTNCFHHLELAISPRKNVGLFGLELSSVRGGGRELNSKRWRNRLRALGEIFPPAPGGTPPILPNRVWNQRKQKKATEPRGAPS